MDLTFTSRSRGGKTVVVAQGKNPHRDKAAVVVFSGQGVTSKPIVLQPGMGFSQAVGKVEQFEIEVSLSEPRPTEKGAIDKGLDFVKSKVREQVTTKDGKMKPSGGVAGPRG